MIMPYVSFKSSLLLWRGLRFEISPQCLHEGDEILQLIGIQARDGAPHEPTLDAFLFHRAVLLVSQVFLFHATQSIVYVFQIGADQHVVSSILTVTRVTLVTPVTGVRFPISVTRDAVYVPVPIGS